MDSTASDPPVLLFVDDEPASLSALRRLFGPPGCRVLLTESGPMGPALLEKANIAPAALGEVGL